MRHSAQGIAGKIVSGPMEGIWAPGYYYVLFDDPDGIRLEVNFVPCAGLLAEGCISTRVWGTAVPMTVVGVYVPAG